jgi:hypothetical protein
MKHAARVVRWESTVDETRCGIEIAGLELGRGRMEAELDRVLGRLKGVHPVFVIAGFAPSAPRDLAKAISRSCDSFSSAHVCLAIDHETLLAMDPAILRDKRFGILLDEVNAKTPLSAVISDSVEAVRFDEKFLEEASTDLRLSCVVDSMLRLAHDLGLATLGSMSSPVQRRTGEFEFDYVSAPKQSESRAI